MHSGRTGTSLRRSWGARKPFLAPLKLSWDGLGCSWGGLGAPLGGSCGHLRPILQKNSKKSKKTRKNREILEATWEAKRSENHEKSILKAGMLADSFFKRFFSNFYWFLKPNFDVFLIGFWIRSENVDFVKIVLPPAREHDFSGFKGLEINKKLTKHRCKIRTKKW